MATLSKPVGYECEFVDQVPEDYFCKQCKHVAREPTIASCCTEVLCKACIETVIQDKKPCPSCQETDITSLPHKKYQAKILALKVCCLMKGRGCEWTGQLQHLDAHLHLTTGDCVYVDVDCPSKCNQKVQKRNVKTHLANECLERQHVCRFCGFTATFREVDQHLETCELYILDCPNRCGVSFERNVLEDHMKMCGLQKVQCDFSHTGCEAEFLRNKQNDHSEQNTQKHLALVAATLRASQEQQQAFEQKLEETFEQKLQQQQQKFEKKLLEQQQKFEKNLQKQQEDLRVSQEQQQALEHKLKERDEQIKALEEKVSKLQEITEMQFGPSINLLRMETGLFPYDITFSYYQDKYFLIDSPPMYTHPGGYRFSLRVLPNGDMFQSTHVKLKVRSLKSHHDDSLKFPAAFTITLQLLNQHRDQDHITRDIHCTMATKKKLVTFLYGWDYTFIPKADLEWNDDKQTQYLKDDCLKIRMKKITIN